VVGKRISRGDRNLLADRRIIGIGLGTTEAFRRSRKRKYLATGIANRSDARAADERRISGFHFNGIGSRWQAWNRIQARLGEIGRAVRGCRAVESGITVVYLREHARNIGYGCNARIARSHSVSHQDAPRNYVGALKVIYAVPEEDGSRERSAGSC